MHGENKGHGHVFKRPDGVVARCGGPGMCADCARDYYRKMNPAPPPVHKMTREQTAEWVGYYFGLQRASNMSRDNNLRTALDAEMGDVLLKMPPGTIEAWPGQLPLNETDS